TLAPSVTATSFAAMLSDAQARWLFVDGAANDLLPAADDTLRRIALDTKTPGLPFEQWLAGDAAPVATALQPDAPFNIIYSSGTTGTPKGIVQSHGMRWSHVMRGANYRYGPDTVTL